MVRNIAMKFRITMIVLSATALLIGCGDGEQQKTPQTKQVAAVMVQTEPVQQMDFPKTLRLGGNLRGNRQTIIPARVTTTVTKIPVKVGQEVRKGDQLVMLDPGGVQSQYHQSEAVFRNAEKQRNRMRTLYDAGAISETQLDVAETEYEVARANFNSARQSIEIEAPFEGVVTGINVRIGDEVSPGWRIIEVADVTSMRLLLDVSAAQAGALTEGQTVRVPLPMDNSVVMTGNVHSVADAANRATRSFEVECHFPAPPTGFAPGMYVTAEIETEILSSALVVPSQAILYRSGKAMLYVINDNTASLVTVTELAEGQGSKVVNGDLTPGQKVVVVGQKNLTPGATVTEAGR
jgi:RND family efflux transporter MFP subunit